MHNICNKYGDICHIIINKHDYDDISSRKDVISPDNPLQLSVIRIRDKQYFPAHIHNPCDKTVSLTQEAWVVLSGRILVRYYDEESVFLTSMYLETGEVTCTLKGGHYYEGCENDTIVLEFKTGPYLGRELDKTLL